LENNHVLMPGAFSSEWYALLLKKALGLLPAGWETATASHALAWSRECGVPLHPRYNLFSHSFAVEDLRLLRQRSAGEGRAPEDAARTAFALPDRTRGRGPAAAPRGGFQGDH